MKGTSQVTVADVNGTFSFNNLDENAVLVVSYTGFSSREVSIKKKWFRLEKQQGS